MSGALRLEERAALQRHLRMNMDKEQCVFLTCLKAQNAAPQGRRPPLRPFLAGPQAWRSYRIFIYCMERG
jgi:hypothetical protein